VTAHYTQTLGGAQPADGEVGHKVAVLGRLFSVVLPVHRAHKPRLPQVRPAVVAGHLGSPIQAPLHPLAAHPFPFRLRGGGFFGLRHKQALRFLEQLGLAFLY